MAVVNYKMQRLHTKAEVIANAKSIAGMVVVRWLGTRETVPLIQALQVQAETWRTAELQRARKLLAKGDDIDAVLEALSRGLTQKLLHGPMAGLQHTEGEERRALSQTLSRLFLQCPMRGRWRSTLSPFRGWRAPQLRRGSRHRVSRTRARGAC